ncbi:MAG: hypothetical protein PHT75_03130 [Bacilli bacterium]|nr:hypothetical protein [Bacilli bacterium]MDD3305091.1 hypothetical protein [Bacilli bacterium]MDD4410898.1 hypothetical protein [Bacilli bacterium]
MMKKNIDLLLTRITDSIEKMDCEQMISSLEKIKDNCICIGTGGSYIASAYAKEVIGNKNNVIAVNLEPRDILYSNIGCFKNLCAFSYGGNNHGINKALEIAGENRINRLVFTTNNKNFNDLGIETVVNYKGNLEREVSFISIASTLTPMSLLLKYYLNDDNVNLQKIISDLYHESNNEIDNVNSLDVLDNKQDIDIMTGDNTYVAAAMLESTLVEAGLGRPLLHEKYSYCHGRTTLAYHSETPLLVYLINGEEKEIDRLLLENIQGLYERVLLVKTNKDNKIVGEFELTLKMIFLAKKIAEKLDKDLSIVNYAPQVKRLYNHRGGM